MICTSKPHLQWFVLTELFWKWGKRLRENSLMRSWLGSDRTISRTFGSSDSSFIVQLTIFVLFFWDSAVRRGKIEEILFNCPSLYIVIFNYSFLNLSTFCYFSCYSPPSLPQNIQELKNGALEHLYLLSSVNICYHFVTFAVSTYFTSFLVNILKAHCRYDNSHQSTVCQYV